MGLGHSSGQENLESKSKAFGYCTNLPGADLRVSPEQARRKDAPNKSFAFGLQATPRPKR